MMRKVLYSLAPIFLFSIWSYGLRALAIAAVTFACGVLVEFLFERKRSGKVSEAVLVSCALYALSMPPAVPLWIVGLGIAFGVFMAKEVYGGFGRNVFNPAIAGRLFVYISFAVAMGRSWLPPGNFGLAAGSLFGAADAATGATPLAAMRSGGSYPILDLILGFRPGSIGESPLILIAMAAVYLIATKTANWRLMASQIAGGAALAAALYFLGVKQALPMESLLAGSFAFTAVFMVTDPVTAPKKKPAQYAYGFLIGAAVVVIRTFSLFPEGTSFAILLGNTFGSLFDKIATDAAARKKGAASATAKAAEGAES
jgi:Na+-transporting NADH:ubiquinone oxidoreductase subunit B